MKKKPGIRELLTAVILCHTSLLFAQSFTEQTTISLTGVADGSAIWGDADNDGDTDILIAGYDDNYVLQVKLYRNNGSNSFSDAGTIFSQAINYWEAYTMSAQWVDFDYDGFLDIIINSPNGSRSNNLLIYRHEADHSYLLKTTINFWTWQGNSMDCGDYDNDGDQDILLVTNSASRIYQNQGNFSFIERTSISLDGLIEGSSHFGDYDVDGDLDILITGYKDSFTTGGTFRIYRNNGNNSFTLQSGISISGSYDGSAEWGDYNNDGYLDILTTSRYDFPRLNKNNGNNTFSLENAGIIHNVSESTGKWGDLDNDGDIDIVLSGKYNNTNITKAYINNGNNTFSEMQGFTVEGVYKSSIDLFDYDNDGDLDILLSGDNGTSKISKVYKNGITGSNPAPGSPTGLTATTSGNDIILSWNQVKTDNTPAGSMTYNVMVGTSSGAINIVSPNSNTSSGLHRISGFGNGQTGTTYILRNLQKGLTYYWKVQAVDNSWKGSAFASGPNFTYNSSIQATALNVPQRDGSSATLAWTRGNGANCAVFLKEANSGTAVPANGSSYTPNPVFTSGTQIGATGWYCVYSGTGSTISVTNLKANTNYIFQVIEYTGTIFDPSTSAENPYTFKTGSFSLAANLLPVSLIYLNNFPTNLYWVDIDNDSGNDLDLIMQGAGSTILYRNDGSGIFNLVSSSLTQGTSSALGDFNNDGLIDLAIGKYPANVLYRNTGSGIFAEQAGAFPFISEYGAMDWGDYDNDGDLDLLITGTSSTDGKTSRIFKNEGGGSFTELQSVTLTGVAFGSAKWADYDNDGNLDLIITGSTNSSSNVTKLYRNTGNNTFTEQTGTGLEGFSNTSVDWGDFDNDGDQDLIYTSPNATRIYRNNGGNSFNLLSSTGLPVVTFGSVKWGDYDNDGDLDVLLTGFTGSYRSQITKIFKNNGDNTFTEDLSAVLPGVGSGTAVWGDYDKDGDLDIVIAGNGPGDAIVKIYRNDNVSVNTAPAAPTGITTIVNKSDVTLAWKSVRNDITQYKAMTYNLKAGTSPGSINIMAPNSASNGYRRVASPGNTSSDTTFTFKKMPFGTYYWSVQAVDNGFAGSPFSGEGTFTVAPVQASSLSATIVDNNSLKLKWERGNGERCVVFAKQTSTDQAVPVNNTGYIADAEYGFGGQIAASGWYCVYNGRADSVIITGLIYNRQYSFHIFEYMGASGSEQYFTQVADGNPGVFSTSLFTEQSGITINSGLYNNVAWGDYDNDGFTDILIPGIPNSRIYRNNGNNTFTEKSSISLPPVNYGSADWGDYDRDGDLDIIITGASISYPVSGPATKIYRNDGSDIFTEQISISLTQLFYSSVAWGDYDNDGDLDILLNGASGSAPNYNRVSKVYDNNGNNSFTEQTQIVLEGLYRGSVRWADYDNDGDLDIAMTGAQMETQFNTEGVFRLYRNHGNKTFTQQSITVNGIFREASNSSTAWGDYDNDGDLDFILTAKGFMTLYENLGGNNFNTHMTVILSFMGACYAAWGDYDNDGYLDIILSNPGLDTRIYRNTHGLSVPGAISQWFNKQDDEAVKNVGFSYVNWFDYDNDGDLDFLMSREQGFPSKIFKNNLMMKSGLNETNTAPAAPTGTGYENNPQGVFLRWNSSKDDATASRTLTYNLRIGTTKTNFNITPSHSSSEGYREIPAMGNAQLDTTYLMKNMPAMKYYWSVQAVDQSFRGSAWSSVDSFEVKNVLAFFSADTVCQGLNTTFTNQSVGFGETIQSYKWIFENGATSTLTNPTYSFGSSGVKNVTLIAFSSSTSDTLVKQVVVKSKPLVDFRASVACAGTETILTNLSNVAGLTITSWSWDYGDGKGSTSMHPGTHGYLNSGEYEVILNASADNNCSESITKTAVVGAYPIASISATTPLSFCAGDSVSLSVASYSNHTYRWMSNGVDVTGGNTNRITARNTGNYTTEVINLTGNCKTTSPPAVVNVLSAPAAPLISAPPSTTICEKDSLLLSVSNISGYSYQWKLNGGAVGINSNQYYAKNSGEYSITVTNSNGCSVSSTNKLPVTVNTLPLVGDISHSGNTKFCSDQSITLSITQNPDYKYRWKNGTAETGTGTSSITTSEPGDYTVEVSTLLGCKLTSLPLKTEVVERPAKPAIYAESYKPDTCLGVSPLKLSVKDVVQDYTYKWYKNGTPAGNSTFIETREEGKYYLEAIYDICKSDTASLEVDLKNTLQKPEIIVRGSTVWYLTTPSKASLYKWYYNGILIPGAESSTYVAGQNLGIYRVAISDGSKCYAFSDTVTIKAPGITGIEDPDHFKTLVIYPNPSSGVFNIEMDNNLIGKLSVRIFHQDGKKVFDRDFEKSDEKFLQHIDIGQQRIGLYLVSLYINGQFSNIKFIIE